jgi:peptidyl-prolyl cis-trans isomerase C
VFRFAIALSHLGGFAICTSGATSETLVNGVGFEVTDSDVRAELEYLPDGVRGQYETDPAKLRLLIDDIYRRAAIAHAARAAGLDTHPDYAYRLRRAELEELVAIAVDEQRHRVLGDLPDFHRRAWELYRSDVEAYRTPERVRVRHILLRSAGCDEAAVTRQRLEQIRAQILAGVPFEELARTHSEDRASAERGGDLGLISRGKTVPAFEEAAFELTEPGQVSGIVETDFGLHLIQLVERREARQRPFEEVEDNLIKQLTLEYVKNELDAWRRDVVNPSKARVDQAAIDAFVASIVSQAGSDVGQAVETPYTIKVQEVSE